MNAAVAAGVAIFCLGAVALFVGLFLWLTRDTGTRAAPRERPRLHAALTWAAGAARTVGAWIHARLPQPVAPRPHQPHHARLAAADAATLRWMQAVKPPSPHAGWLHLVTTAAVWRHLAHHAEAQATSYQHDTAWFGAIGDD